MRSQVTTGRGNGGETSGLSGESYSKTHPIMECVGTLDELRAQTALLRLQILKHQPRDAVTSASFLHWLLLVLFPIGSTCSDPSGKRPQTHKRSLTPDDLRKLEEEQLRLERHTPLPQAFLVSATNEVAAQADITRTVARRFERAVVRLKETEPSFEPGCLLPFVNRLSDYLFILARYMEDGRHDAIEFHRL